MTVPALGEPVAPLSRQGELHVGQEVGTDDGLPDARRSAGAGAEIVSFKPHPLRVITSSRKKAERRDADWIARAPQTGMHRHPV
jgi:hypothetical protein